MTAPRRIPRATPALTTQAMMKILELSLQAFGPFTDVTLDFSGGEEGFHLVHGPNEAGKSSALRAIRQALFGIPTQSPDDFVHKYAKLRIGMKLRDDEGRELAFVRRKGAKNTLLAADGSTPLADSALARFLGGMTETEFCRRFALDHDELVAGGRSIVEGSGELGQLLFQAGGGLKDLLEVQRVLDREVEALFKPTGSKPRINVSLDELKEAKAAMRAACLPGSEWVEHDAGARRAAAQLEELDTRLGNERAEKRRLERIASALPLVARRRQCQDELQALGPVVLLAEDFTGQRHQATAALEAARTAESTAEQAIVELEKQIDALVVPEALLAEAESIERIRDALAGYRKARADLPDERGRLGLVIADLRELLADLRPDAGTDRALQADDRATTTALDPALLEAAEAFRPARAQKALIGRLSAELARLSAQQEQAAARQVELAARLKAEQVERARIEDPGDTEPLAIALRHARDQGDLDAQVEAARARLDQARREASEALDRLPLLSGPRDLDADRSAPPAPETVDLFESEFAAVEAERVRLRSARIDAEQQIADAEASLAALRESAGLLPTEDDLTSLRARRDRIWRLIRQSLETGRPVAAAELAAALAESSSSASEPDADELRPADPSAALLTAFERTVERADALVDRLRREADRVAAQVVAREAMERASRRLELLNEHGRQVDAQARDIAARWRAAWEPVGVDPLSPREMRGWLAARQEAVSKAAIARARREELDALRSRCAAHRAALGRAISVLGEDEGGDAVLTFAEGNRPGEEALTPLRDRAESILARRARAASRRDELRQSIEQLERDLEAAAAQARTVGERQLAWRDDWSRAIAPLGLPPEATPEQVEAVIEVTTSLAARAKEARQTATRIDSLERDAGQFAALVAEIRRRVAGPPGAGTSTILEISHETDAASVVAAAQELIRRLAEARQADDRRTALRDRLEQERTAARLAREAREDAERRLSQLCRDAERTAPDDLPEAERASREARRLQQAIQELDLQLGGLCGHEPPDVFRRAAETADADRLPDRIAILTAEIDLLDAERARLNQDLGEHRGALARMNGEGRAALANERVEQIEARLALEVEEYARLRLASLLLREAVERYRQKAQGPVLERADALFAALTVGSFAGLKVDYNDRDEPVLLAVRPGGAESVGIRGLSLGTADQLYLALRIASLEAALEARGAVPVIADDILIQFDDRRTAAALEVLAGLSDRTQIILFTHHEHVCRLARDHVPPDRLFVHRLPGRAESTGRPAEGAA